MVNKPAPSLGQHAPAVARAMRAIERLAAAGEPCSLSGLSRELGIGPSSLLTILGPLREAGVVVRDGAGRYALGPTLVGLGEAAARACTAVQLFERLAEPLVDRTGETVLLWSACGDGFALAAAREGRHPLRFVPTAGLRLADEWAAHATTAGDGRLVEGELLPDVWMIAVPLPTGEASVTAVVALAGPANRLRGAAAASLRAALRAAVADLVPGGGTFVAAPIGVSRGAVPGQAGPTSRDAATVPTRGVGPEVAELPTGRPARQAGAQRPGVAARPAANWELAGPIDDAELDAFLRQSHVATLSYVADDGYPATVPLWYAWDGTAFWLAPRPGAEWAVHVRLDPRVSLAVSESVPPLRRVLARGKLVAVDDPDGGQARHVASELATRYAGCGAARPGEAPTDGPLLRLVPERLIAWRGLLRHPRVTAESTEIEGQTGQGQPDRGQADQPRTGQGQTGQGQTDRRQLG